MLFSHLLGKNRINLGEYAHRKDISIMYRDRLEELRKEKGISNKKWSEDSGVSIDTIGRIIRPENPEKDSPRVNTIEDLCKVLGVEVWEIFYSGDRSFVNLQAENLSLKAERDDLIAQIAILENKNKALQCRVDSLVDVLILKLSQQS